MRIRVQSQSTFVLHKVVEFMRHQQEQRPQNYSSSIEMGLTELVRDQMRQSARRAEQPIRTESQGLDAAIGSTAGRVQEWMSEFGLKEEEFDLEVYWASVKRRLKYPAREISQLSGQLRQARQTERLGSRQERVSLDQILFEVREIGLRNAIEGVIVTPLVEECGLDLERLEQQQYVVEGEWFPFQLEFQEWRIVLDDDATLTLSTENLPASLALEARAVVTELAEQLYISPYQL